MAHRVLVMDDEKPIRNLLTRMLTRMGLEAEGVADGQEALRVFERARHDGKPFSLVVVDLTVPGGMGGRETIERLRTLDAEVPVLVASGYSNDPVVGDPARYGFVAMVSKPFRMKEFQEIVESVLGI